MGKIVVTGANRGIGFAVARELVASGKDVVLLCRDPERGAQARDMLARLGPGCAQLVLGSLDSCSSIRRAADELASTAPVLDVLVHNAGVWPSRLERNQDGLERAFVVNHLAPFLLNHLLLPMLAAGRGRVVQLSAGIYIKGRPSLERTPTGADFSALGTYATTKLCNLLLLARFAELFRPHAVTVNALHPGVIRTGLGDRDDALGALLKLVKRLWKAPEEGARPVVRLALDPSLDGKTGGYYELERETELRPIARDTELSRRLWSQAAELVGL
jgi:NAD(P)-dependent dehydrogenase (short-subunit alcohol dehydrogenase family)